MSALKPALRATNTIPTIEPSVKESKVILSHCDNRVIANPVKKVTKELIKYLFCVFVIFLPR